MSELLGADDVTTVVQVHLGSGARCTGVSRTPTGNSQETYFVTIEGIDGRAQPVELVLRRSAAGGTLEWSERRLEVAVLDAAHDAGLPVPKVWWWEPDGSALERSYTVMDRSPGVNPDLRNASVCTELTSDLGRHLARLHLDVSKPTEFPDPVDSAAASRAQLDWWVDRARSSPLATEVAAALCGWLTSNVPDDGVAPVLLWGDPGPHNVLIDERGSITALLDWELAHIGHPMFDLGAARWACLGQLDRELVTTAYEREVGERVDREVLRWFEVLACVTRSVMLYDGMAAVADGRSHDPNVLALGLALVNANMVRATHLAWGISTSDATANSAAIGCKPSFQRPSAREHQHAIARFLDREVQTLVTESRVRRNIKIASALLKTLASAEAVETEVADPWVGFDNETGGESIADRRRLVAQLASERLHLEPLTALYGATVDID